MRAPVLACGVRVWRVSALCHVLEGLVKAADYSVLWLSPSVRVRERIMAVLKPEYYKEKIIEHS
jgi:hypothetical protein